MAAFQSGFQLGSGMYQQALDNMDRAEKRKREEEAHRLLMEEGGLRTDAARMALARSRALESLSGQMTDTISGLDRPATNTALDNDFAAANQAALAGYALPPMAGPSNAANEAALTVRRPVDLGDPAFQQKLGLLQTQYAAKAGDVAGLNAALGSQTKLAQKADMQKFIQTGKALYDARTESPEALQKWLGFVSPYTKMISQYNGLKFDSRANPETGAIEIIPYKGGKVQEVSFEETMPYMLVAHSLSSKYGDPETAINALHNMTEAQRKKVMDESLFGLNIQDKVGASVRGAKELGIKQQEVGPLNRLRNAQAGYWEAGKPGSGGSAGSASNKAELWNQAVELAKAGNYGGNPERAFEALSRGYIRNGLEEQASKIENELWKSGLEPKEIAMRMESWWRERGMAKPAAIAAFKRGINPLTGKRLTAQDLNDWNRTYPNTPVEDLINYKEVGPGIPSGPPGGAAQNESTMGPRIPGESWSGLLPTLEDVTGFKLYQPPTGLSRPQAASPGTSSDGLDMLRKLWEWRNKTDAEIKARERSGAK